MTRACGSCSSGTGSLISKAPIFMASTSYRVETLSTSRRPDLGRSRAAPTLPLFAARESGSDNRFSTGSSRHPRRQHLAQVEVQRALDDGRAGLPQNIGQGRAQVCAGAELDATGAVRLREQREVRVPELDADPPPAVVAILVHLEGSVGVVVEDDGDDVGLLLD